MNHYACLWTDLCFKLILNNTNGISTNGLRVCNKPAEDSVVYSKNHTSLSCFFGFLGNTQLEQSSLPYLFLQLQFEVRNPNNMALFIPGPLLS